MTDISPLDEVAADIRGSLFTEGDLEGLAIQLKQGFENGHPAIMAPLPPGLYWQDRVQPIAIMLDAISAAEIARQPVRQVTTSNTQIALPRFDLAVVPEAALGHEDTLPVAGIGPCLAHRASMKSFFALTRANLFSHLSTAVPGIFLIDWAGLQSEALIEADEGREWADLWSIADMRLNRQIMDACRIANDRGWQIKVIGPVHRSSAPLFRTVADLFDVIHPSLDEVAS
ncbi:hypothetical protein M527_01140 [Sphingobium indicum IP26]|nr:hypothetical protein M527_01140 [Sphingobium indicum IP26]